MQETLKAKPADLADMKIAAAAGLTAYLKQTKVKDFFDENASKDKLVEAAVTDMHIVRRFEILRDLVDQDSGGSS